MTLINKLKYLIGWHEWEYIKKKCKDEKITVTDFTATIRTYDYEIIEQCKHCGRVR
jgi:hypothetical protein